LIPHLVMASGLVVADRFILQHYRNLSEVGVYSLAYTFGMVMYLVTQSLSQAWLPMFFELASDHEKNRERLGHICSWLTVLLAAIASIGILLSPIFIHITLDSRYQPAANIVPLVVLGYLFHALFSLFDLSILQAKRTASVFSISLLAFAVNMALNFAAIPRWGIYGAAWATAIAYMVEAVGAFFLAQRSFSLPYKVPEMLAATAVASGALWMTQLHWAPGWGNLVLISSLLLALGLLILIGKRDLLNLLAAMRSTRQSISQNKSL
jgi:O-antigen/teichoic acid export membrane protein